MTFDSIGEMNRYKTLMILQASGKISNLERQKTFKFELNGVLICKYTADFTYTEAERQIVEDYKGFQTPEFKIKNKMMKAFYGIELKLTGK